jgi:hypothetical protein
VPLTSHNLHTSFGPSRHHHGCGRWRTPRPSQPCGTLHTLTAGPSTAPPQAELCAPFSAAQNHAHSSLDTPLSCNDTQTTELVQV